MTLSRIALSRRALGILFSSAFAGFALAVLLTNGRSSVAADETVKDGPAKSKVAEAETAKEEKWIPLFNGKDLEGWTPKIRFHELGDNFANTFRVEDGVIKVRYDGYEKFGETFGHLFYKTPYSHYRFRCEYRFVGDQCPGGPGWAIRNSGVMIHGQDAATMGKDQDFPVSIEVQLLGGDGKNPRATGNLCTPGTNVVMGGQLVERHCTNSRRSTIPKTAARSRSSKTQRTC
jgi:hypothetical protein